MSLTKKFYSVFLITGDHIPIQHSNGVFEIEHNTEYGVAIFNHHPKKCADATVFIDGKSIGYFRVNAGSKIIIERPSDSEKARKLTFYDVNSQEGGEGAVSISNPSLGILKVVIATEADPPPPIPCYPHAREADRFGEDSTDTVKSVRSSRWLGGTLIGRGLHADCAATTSSAGGTALGKESSQRFTPAPFMKTETKQTVIEGKMILKRRPVVPL